MKNKLRKRKNPITGFFEKVFLLTGIFAISITFLYAETPPINELGITQQERISIKGKVTDDKGEALPGVNVIVKGTTTGTITDSDGNFMINVPNRQVVLAFSFISYKKIEQTVGNKDFLSVVLMEDVNQLDETVVIGYQTVAKRKVHGAVTSVRAQDLEGITAPSVDIMLQGMVPGLNVQTFTGEPGGRNTFTIRGNTEVSNAQLTSSPLIVLDGVPVDPSVVGYSASNTNFLANINPNDIESLDFLKDAAAASIYGSKGANGVLIINTKRGKSGKPKINFNGRFGIATKPVTPDIYVGAEERWAKLDLIQTYGSGKILESNPQMLTDSLNPMFNNAVNWFDLYYKDAIVQDYNLTISGGDVNSNYRLGGGYYSEDGTIIGTGFNRFSFSGSIVNYLLNGRLQFTTSGQYSRTSRRPVPGDVNDKGEPVGGSSAENAINMDISNMPSSLLLLTETDKKAILGQYEQSIDDNQDDMILLNEEMELNILKDKSFNFTTRASYMNTQSRRDLSQPSTSNINNMAWAFNNAKRFENWSVEPYFTLNKIFGEGHNIMAVLGGAAEGSKKAYTYLRGNYLSSDYIHVINGVTKDYLYGYTSIEEATMLSYFGRLNYFYKDRYGLSGSLRRDGSSRFGPGKRWGTFPTASAFWILSEESFMESLKETLSLVKFRASWGKSGSLPGGFYGYYNRYETLPSTYDGESGIAPFFAEGIAQKDLSWEESKEWNLGLDLELMEGRFYFTADVYNKEKHGIFYSFNLPQTVGYEKYFTNAVSVRNAGLELSLMARILPKTSKWQWSVMVNGAYNQNTLMELPDGNRTVIEDERYLMVGHPINVLKLSKYNGVFSTKNDIPFNPYTGILYQDEGGRVFTPGSGYYEDIDRDYRYYSYKDMTPVGDPNPKWIGGMSTNLSYKRWNLLVHASFTLGRDILNKQLANTLGITSAASGVDEEGVGFSGGPTTNYTDPTKSTWYYTEDYLARRMMVNLSKYSFWRKDGDIADYPSRTQYTPSNNFIRQSSMFLENGSYLKLNTIMLSYNFDLRSIGINTLRASFTAENVAIVKSKNTKAADPSNVTENGMYTGNGYGLPRKFTVGIMLDF